MKAPIHFLAFLSTFIDPAWKKGKPSVELERTTIILNLPILRLLNSFGKIRKGKDYSKEKKKKTKANVI